ncbi:MAG: phosphoribosylglycinamide formyltransferase [Phycisphaerae bacterium]|nr:phosphoribosylglycinamide formyltransferase [Phycisphaerae bacterium]
MPARLAVFISGSGRSMINLLDRSGDGRLDAEVAVVVASKPCKGADLARERGVDVLIPDHPLTDAWLVELVRQRSIDLIILAGYIRHLPIPAELEGRILNIHPGLLPGDGTPGRFGGKGMHGAHVHRAVIEAGEPESGCTVHRVTNEYDAGPVILRKTCPVLPDDTPESLAARVFDLELEAYPEAIAKVIAPDAAVRTDRPA